jgi:hypothetical protein
MFCFIWTEGSYHWGEPEMGYFLSKDKFVIRRDMSMLADAGVDVLIELVIAVPRTLLGLKGDAVSFDFKWADNPTDLKEPMSLCTSGDTAPNRRFNYRFLWRK